jgi:signal transduction histidine kinase
MRALEETGKYEIEMRAVLSDGSVRWLQSRGAVKFDADRKPLRLSGVAQDITERKTMEMMLHEWNHELERRVTERTKSLRNLATELNLAEQRERRRLATDLHDHLQQLLATCKLKLGHMKLLGELDGGRARLTNETEELLAEALNYTRTLVAELSPPVLSQQGLGAGLKWLSDYMKRFGMSVTVSVPERRVRGLPEDQAVLLFQSVRELLFNASKHAGTKEAWISFEQNEGGLRIEVRDNGVGFAASAMDAPSEGSSKFGLFSIRERMSALGGSLHITSSPEVGTRAVLLLPLIRREEPPLELSRAMEVQASKKSPR